MFTSNMVESNKDRITIKDIDGATLALLVEYMYSGRLDIDESNVQCLLSTATILQLACVRDACSRCVLNILQIDFFKTVILRFILLLKVLCGHYTVNVGGGYPSAASKRRDRAAHARTVAAVAYLGFLDSFSSHLMITNKKTN
ncbi:hypothetical protein Y032_0124g1189 [Ancylostoma ceylanicum]|uniref:BTB domain-containing protein n=1 Tax=Ancylostoma ceylanicum TaxID=53326 RepID=A0A016T8X4_9BILA|nr:hypothetical protein Y032_0124g1189 [Ancylostoma ceylanicum]